MLNHNQTQSERLTWSLTPHPPAGAFAHKDSASPLLTLSEEIFGRQDLHLRRAMLAGLLPVYVDRFARAWHRLSTTDALGLHTHYRNQGSRRQAPPYDFDKLYSGVFTLPNQCVSRTGDRHVSCAFPHRIRRRRIICSMAGQFVPALIYPWISFQMRAFAARIGGYFNG